MNRSEIKHETKADLITKINPKNDAFFTILYDQYWDRLLNFTGHYLPDRETCKEIVQELFITLHAKRNSIIITTSLSSYLYSSLRNRITNYIRDETLYKKHVAVAGRNEIAVKTYNNVEQFMNFTELKREISYCLNRMPKRYKEVYLLHMQNQYRLVKIAAILRRPLATVEKQLKKATEKLRQHLRARVYYT